MSDNMESILFSSPRLLVSDSVQIEDTLVKKTSGNTSKKDTSKDTPKRVVKKNDTKEANPRGSVAKETPTTKENPTTKEERDQKEEKKVEQKEEKKEDQKNLAIIPSDMKSYIPTLNFEHIKNTIENHVSSRSLPVFSPPSNKNTLGEKLRTSYMKFHEKIKRERIKLKINKIETDAMRLASIGKEEMIFFNPLSPSLVVELEKSGVRYNEDTKSKRYSITWIY